MISERHWPSLKPALSLSSPPFFLATLIIGSGSLVFVSLLMCLTLRPSKTHFVTVDEEKASARFLHPPHRCFYLIVCVFFDTSLSLLHWNRLGLPYLLHTHTYFYYLSSISSGLCVFKEKAQ